MSEFLNKDFFVGKNIGKYRVIDILGAGGMGVVYRAFHTLLEREVAIKLILPNKNDPNYKKRFMKEAKLLAGLKHPNIVEIFDFDFTEEGHYPYYVMEFLKGKSLKEKIDETGPFPIELFCEYMEQIASALSYAHGKGIIHRDLKPPNILVTREEGKEILKILDFGIAKSIAVSDEESTMLTGTSEVLGTPYYIAPEQFMKEKLGPYTDIYALGLIAVEMLTGMPYRRNKTIGEIIVTSVKEPVKLPSDFDFPEYIVNAIRKATYPDKEKRFKDAKEFVYMLCGNEATVKIGVNREINNLEKSDEDLKKTVKIKDKFESEIDQKGVSSDSSFTLKRLSFIFFLIFVLITSLFFLLKRSLEKKNSVGLSASKTILDIPPQVTNIISNSGNNIYLSGANSIFYVNVDDKKVWNVPLLYDEENIGSDYEGYLFTLLKEKGQIFLRKIEDGKRVLVAGDIPYAKITKISPSGKYLIQWMGDKVITYKIKEKKLEKLYEFNVKTFLSENEALRILKFTISEKYIAFFVNTHLNVYLTVSGKKIFEYNFKDLIGKVCVALQDEPPMVAIGGWSDKIYVFDLIKKSKLVYKVPGRTYSLKFLPFSDRLVAGREDNIMVLKDGKVLYKYEKKGAKFTDVMFTHMGIVAIEKMSGKLYAFNFKDFTIVKKIKVSKKELWSMVSNSKKIFIGGSDGKIKEYLYDKNKLKKVFSHDNGVTWMGIAMGKYLVSASDDRTIGIFSLPDVKLLMRSKAHKYLVNYLFFPNSKNSEKYFWSSSYDGTIKKWLIPDLEEEEIIDTGRGNYSFAAFWTNGKVLFAGSWGEEKGDVVLLKKVAGKWKITLSKKIESRSIYQMKYLPDAKLVVGIGIYPSNLYVYDLLNDKIHFLPLYGSSFSWIIRDGNFIYLFGKNLIGKYGFRRSGKKLLCSYSVICNTNLRYLMTGTKVNDHVISIGNEIGEMFLIDPNDIYFSKFFTTKMTAFAN